MAPAEGVRMDVLGLFNYSYFGTHSLNDEKSAGRAARRQTLLLWFEAHGGIFGEQIEITSGSSLGYYLIVKEGQNLVPGSCIVSCPKVLTLSYLNALSSEFSEGQSLAFPLNFTMNVDPHVVVRFFLMEQYLLKTESFWWPYIQLLPSPQRPESLSTPMWYSEEDVVWIRGTNLQQAVQDRERSWRAEYKDGLRRLLLERRHFYSGMLRRATEEYSWNLYKWAATIMSSRSFPASCLSDTSRESVNTTGSAMRDLNQGKNSSVLLPVFDFANHHPEAQVTWEWNRSDCRLIINNRVEEKAQIYNNYGPKSNEELVMGYGFSLVNNQNDQYALKMTRRTSKGNNAINQLQRGNTTAWILTDVPDSSVKTGAESSNHKAPVLDVLDNVGKDREPTPKIQKQESGTDVTEEDRPAERRAMADIQDEPTSETTSGRLVSARCRKNNLDLLHKANLKGIYGIVKQNTSEGAKVAAQSETPNPDPNLEPIKNEALENFPNETRLPSCPEVDIHYVRLPSHQFGDYPNGINALTAFPLELLDDISVIVANDREAAAVSQTLGRYRVDEWDNQITRNKLNVMCHLMMIIQKQFAGIVKWQGELPASPQNDKQFHAACYRRSQLQILTTVSTRLLQMHRNLSGLTPTVTRDVRVVRLEHILAESPLGFATDFRNALKVGLGTRNATKVRESGWVDLVFTLWVCGLWLSNSELGQDDKQLLRVAFKARILQWLVFLRSTYWRTLVSQDEHQLHGHGGTSRSAERQDPMESLATRSSSDDGPTSFSTELHLIAESYLAVVHAAAGANSNSVFARPEWTVEYLAWGLNIVKQEGFMCPNLEGKEADDAYDEYVLFMECGNDAVNVIGDIAGKGTRDGAGNAAGGVTREIAGDGAGDIAGIDTEMKDAPA